MFKTFSDQLCYANILTNQLQIAFNQVYLGTKESKKGKVLNYSSMLVPSRIFSEECLIFIYDFGIF